MPFKANAERRHHIPKQLLPAVDADRYRSQTITYDLSEATDVGLHYCSPVVASSLLPSHAAALGDGLQVTVSHRRRGQRDPVTQRIITGWAEQKVIREIMLLPPSYRNQRRGRGQAMDRSA